MKRPFSPLQFLKQASSFDKIKLYAPGKDRRSISAMLKWIAGILLISIFLVSCSSSRGRITPQILTFNYIVMANVNASDLVRDVQNGSRTIPALLGSNPCNFTADFSNVNHPSISANGTPGQMGFNVFIVSVNPSNITTTNPSSCIAINEIQIAIGGRSEALALGAQTRLTEGKVVLANGSHFDISDFFQGRVQTFDAATRRTSGDFRFITGLAGNSNTVLIVEGSYGITP